MKKMTLTFSVLVVVAFGFTKVAQSQISAQQYQASLHSYGIFNTK